MGIIKLIGKVFSWSTDTILPEVVCTVGVFAQLAAIGTAYEAHSSEKVEAYDDSGNRTPEDDTIAVKTNPASVYLYLLPSDNFSIRKAIKTYKELDEDGRFVFWTQTVAFACGGYYGIANLMRLKRAIVAKNMMKYDLDCAEEENAFMLSKLKRIGQESIRIAKWYDNNGYVNARADYTAALNGNQILSLAVETRSVDTPNSFFMVYNFNVETGNRLTRDEVAAIAGTTTQDVLGEIIDDINTRCDNLDVSGGMLDQMERSRARSLAQENLDQAQFFFDENGVLNAVYRYYWIAGAENYGALLKTSFVCQLQR